MASTYSSLKIQLMGTGENSGTWGTVTNTNLGTALEEAIVGSADVNFSSADVTLTLTDSNSSQSARNLRLNLTGSVGAPQNLIVPAIEKVYIINNGLTQTITVKNATGTGISVPAGKTEYVYNNGTNVVEAINHLTSLTIDTPLPTSSGGTGSNATTYCNLQSNVSGTLPNANTTATASNGASTIVARDGSGNFAANVITGTLSGSASTLTTARNFQISGGATAANVSFDGSSAVNLSVTGMNASVIDSGTLAVARGGTGTASPSLVGGTNITISGTWPNQTVTAAGGGVTSLNGQTGAVTTTSVDSIGATMNVYYAINSPYPNTSSTYTYSYTYQGNTAAGSTLRYGVFGPSRTIGGQVGVPWNSGGTTLSGTWRSMGVSYTATIFNGCSGTSSAFWEKDIWVRVS
jgi:hypothetical protein